MRRQTLRLLCSIFKSNSPMQPLKINFIVFDNELIDLDYNILLVYNDLPFHTAAAGVWVNNNNASNSSTTRYRGYHN